MSNLKMKQSNIYGIANSGQSLSTKGRRKKEEGRGKKDNCQLSTVNYLCIN
ncbi:MAG: hypothetical protein HC849_08305 [Oscillatoriales cyanobacterium RU_3_3]|nr:hypothetical protein [Microcoleus sp. SM1_3_4]NJM60179.1 hypothetical protein [Oscillatoriales cyanobacterium RU_3_3]NJR22878.1 hypothetical protein [Richelia sp. CSU_2_1]